MMVVLMVAMLEASKVAELVDNLVGMTVALKVSKQENMLVD
jgi:hypothetical protein